MGWIKVIWKPNIAVLLAASLPIQWDEMSSLGEAPPTQNNDYANNVVSTMEFTAKISQLLYSNWLW